LAAQEQASGLQQVNVAVNQMDQVVQQNAAMVEESTAASHALAREASNLSGLMGQFQLSRAASAAAAVNRPRAVANPVRAAQARIAQMITTEQANADTWAEF
jgi:methyl-accepting chemotaxis protein